MNKTVFITGGTKGIGKAVAFQLAESGYDLLLTYAADREQALLTKEELTSRFHNQVHILQADCSEKSSIETIYAFLKEKHICPEAVVFNAGMTCRDPFETMQPDEWENVFFANVHFPVFCLQRILSLMPENSSVVFTGSLMGVHPHSVSLAYGVTKSAVHALVKNLVKFLAPYHIRVNAVAPGFVDTEWQKTKPTDVRRSIESKIALERFCEPEEVAGVYKMLIENKYFNGEIVVVDGGYSYK